MAGYKVRIGDGSEIGPMDLAALRTWIAQGLVDQDSPVMCPGSRRWVPLGTVAELRGQVGAATQPRPGRSRRAAQRVEEPEADQAGGSSAIVIGRPLLGGAFLLLLAAVFGWLAWKPENAHPALDSAPWLQIALGALGLGLALLPGWDLARQGVRLVLLLAALALFPLVGILLAQGERGLVLAALGSAFVLILGLWGLLAAEIRWLGLTLALLALIAGSAGVVRFGYAPPSEAAKGVLEWATQERAFRDAAAGLSLAIPAGWVALRPGSPLLAPPESARLTLAQPRQGGFAWLQVESAPAGVATAEQYLDRLLVARRGARAGYQAGTRTSGSLGPLGARRVTASWREGELKQSELVVAAIDGWMALGLVAWMPEAGAGRSGGLDALASGLTATGALAARFRQAVDAAVAAVPHLTPAAAEQLMARSEARVLEPEQAFRRSLVALAERLPALSKDEARELAGLTGALYAFVPWSDRGRLSTYIERVRRGDVTAVDEDRAMARLLREAEEKLPAARRARLQAYYDQAILKN